MTAERGPWNFDETRRLVGAIYGEPQAELLSPCLDSLRARQFAEQPGGSDAAAAVQARALKASASARAVRAAGKSATSL